MSTRPYRVRYNVDGTSIWVTTNDIKDDECGVSNNDTVLSPQESLGGPRTDVDNSAIQHDSSTAQEAPKHTGNNATAEHAAGIPRAENKGTALNQRIHTKHPRIKAGKRVYSKHSQLFHSLTTDEQRQFLSDNVTGSTLYYGTVVSGSSKAGWKIEYDLLPPRNNIVTVHRSQLQLAKRADADSRPYLSQASNTVTSEQHEDSEVQSANEFCKKTETELKQATLCNIRIRGVNDIISWKILKEGEHVTRYPLPTHESHESIEDFDLNAPIIDNLFRHFFPDIKGAAKTMDTYLSDK